MPFDASSIAGYATIEESDKIAKPDPYSFTILPESIEKRKTAKINCDIYEPNGKRFNGDTKYADRVASIEVSEGFAAEEILKKADEFDCDVIVMGTHGKGLISHAFLGSISKRVLRRTTKPVFIIPLPEGESDITFHDA